MPLLQRCSVKTNYALIPVMTVQITMMIVGVIGVVTKMIVAIMTVVVGMVIVTVVMMVITMMIVAVPSCGWSCAADYNCTDNA